MALPNDGSYDQVADGYFVKFRPNPNGTMGVDYYKQGLAGLRPVNREVFSASGIDPGQV